MTNPIKGVIVGLIGVFTDHLGHGSKLRISSWLYNSLAYCNSLVYSCILEVLLGFTRS